MQIRKWLKRAMVRDGSIKYPDAQRVEYSVTITNEMEAWVRSTGLALLCQGLGLMPVSKRERKMKDEKKEKGRRRLYFSGKQVFLDTHVQCPGPGSVSGVLLPLPMLNTRLFGLTKESQNGQGSGSAQGSPWP